MSSSSDSDRVELSIPASVEWLALARTTGAAIASRWSFSYDEIADLRLAIDELCLTLVEGIPAARLDIIYAIDGHALRVDGRAIGVGDAEPVNRAAVNAIDSDPSLSADLSARILDALVDEHGSEESAGARSAWLRKQRSTQDA
ncbi:MAG: ATP-binding protein [Acidimicrobiales bacterium]